LLDSLLQENKLSLTMDSLTSDLASLLLDPEESGDLVLVCADGEVKAHRNIMAARSPTFKAMLESEMEEKRSGRVEVKDFGKSIRESHGAVCLHC